MGLLQFSVATENFVSQSAVSRGDFITFDNRVIPAWSTLTEDGLSCRRQQPDSSKLRLLCRPADRDLVLQTTSLRENSSPYNLEVELARGELSRLRHFYALWTNAGLKTTPELEDLISRAHAAFRQGIFSARPSAAARESICLTCRAVERLTQSYVAQRIMYRQQRTHHFPMSVGCRLTEIPTQEQAFLDTFNAVLVKTRWKDLEPRDGDYQWEKLDALVEWTLQKRLFPVGGPLLDLTSDCFPQWMSPWKGDLLNLQSFTSDFVETVVGRYVGKIRHWEVVCGANRGGENELTEEQRLNLVARAVEAAEAVDEQIQISLRVIQPWGEYLSDTKNRLSPIQFVDALRRCGVKISEINLDLRFGIGPLCSLPRDMLAVSHLLDMWSLLQLPVSVMAAIPEGPRFDSASGNEAPPDEAAPDEAAPEEISWQTKVLEDLFLMCLSKERVIGFYCLNWNDKAAPDQPLADDPEHIHPVVSCLEDLEDLYWPSE
ncbi:MAG: endo-1,4-beta-xylanase [Planctomycetaceae bacterium]|nr:endo-1,4-beta-xylanase [Planctomycetaceae bacterium]